LNFIERRSSDLISLKHVFTFEHQSVKMLFFRVVSEFLRDKDYRDLLFTTIIVLGGGAAVFHYVEGWAWIDAFYFCVMTLTTIGYGDFVPQTDIGKLFNIFYVILGLGLILTFIRTIYEHYDKTKKGFKSN